MRLNGIAVVVALALGIGLLAVPIPAAAQQGWISAGLALQEEESSSAFVYGELNIRDDLAIGVDYAMETLALSAWFGTERGYYGQLGLDDSSLETWEIGLWGGTNPASGLELAGWIGLTGEFDDSSDLQVAVGGEAYMPVQEPFFAVIGADTVVSGNDHPITVRVGLGTSF
ncbi:MAG: hypothetical protein H0Z37_06610 [Firmicutes bacterium]|nr:hypothetical protein [Bacillota bacterium]